MIALGMLYATAVGCLLAAAASAAEQLAVVRRRPRRWAWFGAVLALLILPFATPARVPVAEPVRTVIAEERYAPTEETVTVPLNPTPEISPPRSLRERLALPHVAVPDLARFDRVLLLGWGSITALLLTGYIAAALTLARQRRQWHRMHLEGGEILIAPDLGPAVVGVVRHDVVLPTWSLSLEPGMRRLVLAHEREHLRARDPFLLHFVTLVAYLLPWNVPLWWMLRRLRLAIELDCDTRVIRAGYDAQRYANLLLTVGSRRGLAGRLVAPALMERKSFLFRRIVAIYPPRAGRGIARGLLAAGAVCFLGASAWFIPMPARAHHDGVSTPAASDLSDMTPTEDATEQPDPSEIRGPEETDAATHLPSHDGFEPRPRARPRRSHPTAPVRTMRQERYAVAANDGFGPDGGQRLNDGYNYLIRVDSAQRRSDVQIMIQSGQLVPTIIVNGTPLQLDSVGIWTVELSNGNRLMISREIGGQINVQQSRNGAISIAPTVPGTQPNLVDLQKVWEANMVADTVLRRMQPQLDELQRELARTQAELRKQVEQQATAMRQWVGIPAVPNVVLPESWSNSIPSGFGIPDSR